MKILQAVSPQVRARLRPRSAHRLMRRGGRSPLRPSLRPRLRPSHRSTLQLATVPASSLAPLALGAFAIASALAPQRLNAEPRRGGRRGRRSRGRRDARTDSRAEKGARRPAPSGAVGLPEVTAEIIAALGEHRAHPRRQRRRDLLSKGGARAWRRIRPVLLAPGGRPPDEPRSRLESGAFWVEFVRGLRARGLSGVKLCVSDAHEGLKGAIARVLGCPWQRCAVHFVRDMHQHCRPQQRGMVSAALREVFQAESYEQARERATVVIKRLAPAVPSSPTTIPRSASPAPC